MIYAIIEYTTLFFLCLLMGLLTYSAIQQKAEDKKQSNHHKKIQP